MSLAPFLAASPVIQVHIVAAMAAIVVGGVVLFLRKGTPTHRALGRIWAMLMLMTALTSLFIWTIRMWGLFSPIHLLSLAALFGLWQAVAYARARNIKAHRRAMQMLYLGALLVAGLFTFTPGRLMYEIVFGADGASPAEILVFSTVAILVFGSGFLLLRKKLGWRFGRENARARRPALPSA